MRKFSVALAIALAAAATPAMAQDNGDLGGFSIAAIGGYDVISVEGGNGGPVDRDSGVVYGIAAGYDVDTGDAILGIEAEVSDTSISDGVGDAGLDLYAGLRVGYQIDDNGMVYLKAGYSNVDVDGFDNLDGARVGAGYEHSFGSVFGRLEWRYTTYNVSDTLGVNVNGNRNQIVLAIGSKF